MAKIHNASPSLKSEIRTELINSIGGLSNTSVMETHSGVGEMRKRSYQGVKRWAGIDIEKKTNDTIVCDSKIALRGMDLDNFNLFDVDPFGAPWEHLWIISQRRNKKEGETIALAITSGAQGGHAMRSSVIACWSRQIEAASGISKNVANKWVSGKYAEKFAQRLVCAWFDSYRLTRWITGSSGKNRVWYFGCVLST